MNKLFIRFIAVLLVPCLVGDALCPAGAATFKNGDAAPRFSQRAFFHQQAIVARLRESFHPGGDRQAARQIHIHPLVHTAAVPARTQRQNISIVWYGVVVGVSIGVGLAMGWVWLHTLPSVSAKISFPIPVSLANAGVPVGIVAILRSIASRNRWLGTYMIHHANFERREGGRAPESVGGHEATSASMAEPTTVIEHVRQPEDHVVMIPHAGPSWYGHLLLMIRKLGLALFYRMKQLPGYPSHRTPALGIANPTVPTGSLGKGPVAGIGLAVALQFLYDHGFRDKVGNVWITIGDGEMAEESIVGALRYIKQFGLKNVKIIVNFNRQRLDPVVDDGQAQRLLGMFRNEGLVTEELKYGSLLLELADRPGYPMLKDTLDSLSEREWQSLLGKSDAELSDAVIGLLPSHAVASVELIRTLGSEDFARRVRVLAGHDIPTLLSAFSKAAETPESMAFVVWTIKGKGLPGLEAKLRNHSGKLPPEAIEALREQEGLAPGEELKDFPEGSPQRMYLDQQFQARAAHAAAEAAQRHQVEERMAALAESLPDEIDTTSLLKDPTLSAFDRVLMALSRHAAGKHLVAIAADVFNSMHLSSWVHAMGLWGHPKASVNRLAGKEESLIYKEPSPQGQALSFSNSEQTVALTAAAFGKQPELVPIVDLYDEFGILIAEMLRYAVYWGSRLIMISMVTSAREGSQHQSMMAASAFMDLRDGVLYDPAFDLDVNWMVMASVKRLMRNPKEGRLVNIRVSPDLLLPRERMFELLRRQPAYRELSEDAIKAKIRPLVIKGGYRLIDYSDRPDYKPGKNAHTVFATGKVLDQAIAASEALARRGIYVNVIYVTSPSLLRNGHRSVEKQRTQGVTATSYFERLVPPEERKGKMVAVTDASPRIVDWIGGALGTHVRALGAEEFILSMSRPDMLREADIDAAAIQRALGYDVLPESPAASPATAQGPRTERQRHTGRSIAGGAVYDVDSEGRQFTRTEMLHPWDRAGAGVRRHRRTDAMYHRGRAVPMSAGVPALLRFPEEKALATDRALGNIYCLGDLDPTWVQSQSETLIAELLRVEELAFHHKDDPYLLRLRMAAQVKDREDVRGFYLLVSPAGVLTGYAKIRFPSTIQEVQLDWLATVSGKPSHKGTFLLDTLMTRWKKSGSVSWNADFPAIGFYIHYLSTRMDYTMEGTRFVAFPSTYRDLSAREIASQLRYESALLDRQETVLAKVRALPTGHYRLLFKMGVRELRLNTDFEYTPNRWDYVGGVEMTGPDPQSFGNNIANILTFIPNSHLIQLFQENPVWTLSRAPVKVRVRSAYPTVRKESPFKLHEIGGSFLAR